MNKQKVSDMRYKRVRLFPTARRIDPAGVELPQIDDVWLITDASRARLELRNTRTDHILTLGTDHIREYLTDLGQTDGIFSLKSQVFLFARGLGVQPLPQSR
jgi:hypothetical protein